MRGPQRGNRVAGTGHPLGDRPVLKPPRGQERLEQAGRLIPVRTPAPEPDEYALYVVEPLVDCVDTRRSDRPKKATESPEPSAAPHPDPWGL